MFNLKSASSSLEPLMFVVFPKYCEQIHTHTPTVIQYDYHTLPHCKNNVKITDSLVITSVVPILGFAYNNY